MRTLALIPARAGSKGIPGKNTRGFDGWPLWWHALCAGLTTCDDAMISTDDERILSNKWAIRRPTELAQDDTPMLSVVQHALSQWAPTRAGFPMADYPPDVVVLLQPTQPLRKPEHIKEALRLLEETKADSVVSVVQIPAHHSPDYACNIYEGHLEPWFTTSPERDGFKNALVQRRQDCRPAYSRDGTVYAIRRQTIEAGSLYGSHCVPLVIPSHESVNLDSEEDWIRAEAMVKR